MISSDHLEGVRMKKHEARTKKSHLSLKKRDTPDDKFIFDDRIVRRRRSITIIVAVLAVIMTGVALIMLLRRVPNLHVVFIMALGFSTLLVSYFILWTLCAHEKYHKIAGTLRRFYLICLTIGVVGFLTLQGFIISGAHSDVMDADCLIILGAGLRKDVPSLMLRTRLNAALEYLQDKPDVPVIVSGGMGPGETITEAEAMARYLIARGVDESLIWKEEESTSTKENILFSLALLEEKGLDAGEMRIAIVTNEFHLYRAKLVAGKVGIEADGIAAATPSIYLRAVYFFREAFSLTAEVFFRR